MVVSDIAPTQTDEPLMGTGVENIPSTSDRVSITIVETRSSTAGTDTSHGYSRKIVSPNGQVIFHDNRVLFQIGAFWAKFLRVRTNTL